MNTTVRVATAAPMHRCPPAAAAAAARHRAPPQQIFRSSPATGPRRGASSVRCPSLASDVGRYLSEAASQIFSPATSDVPWEGSSSGFAGKIVHHEEPARLRALLSEVDRAAAEVKRALDAAGAGGAPASEEEVYSFDAAGTAVPPEGSVGAYVVTSIERVFNSNFDPNAAPGSSGGGGAGYAASGRHRSQRELRREYDRLTRFSGLVAKTLEKAEAARGKDAK